MTQNEITVGHAALIIELHEKNTEVFKEMLVVSQSHRKMVLQIYRMLVRDKSIKSVSELPESERTSLWEASKKRAADRLSNDDCIDLAKMLHTVSVLSAQ